MVAATARRAGRGQFAQGTLAAFALGFAKAAHRIPIVPGIALNILVLVCRCCSGTSSRVTILLAGVAGRNFRGQGNRIRGGLLQERVKRGLLLGI